MSYGLRRNAAVIVGLLLLASVALSDWQQLNSGVTGPLYSVHFPEGTQVGYVAGADFDSSGGPVGLIIKTTDGGNTWEPQNPGMVPVLKSVYFKDNNTGFAVGTAGTAIRTIDGGANWAPVTVPVTDMLNRVQFPEDGQTGYIIASPHSGQQSQVLKTTNGGGDWTAVNVGGPASVTRGGSFANDSVGVIVGDDGLVLGTTDGFGSFSYQGPQTTADLVAAAFTPEDPNTGYLIGNDSTHGLIRYTDDGGATLWDSVRCYPPSAFYGVDMPTPDYAFVCGTDGYIGVTVSAHDVWRTITEVDADIYGLCLPNGPDTGFAVGAGGVILRSYNARRVPFALAEEKGPAVRRAEIQVVSNPSRHGVTFCADANVNVVVFDAAGRVVASQAAAKGLNFLLLSKAGTYFVKADAQTVRVVLTE